MTEYLFENSFLLLKIPNTNYVLGLIPAIGLHAVQLML